MKQNIDSLLNSFIGNVKFPFDFFQAANYMGIKKAGDLNYALSWLEANPAVLSVGNNAFASRIGMFTDQVFSILPSRYEIK